MTRVPHPAIMPETAAALQAMFPAWTVSHDVIWRAEKVTGTELRLICAHNVAELAVKLTAAETRPGHGR